MHPLKVDAMVKEARIIVLVKDGEIWGLAKLKRLPKLSQFQLVLYTLIVSFVKEPEPREGRKA